MIDWNRVEGFDWDGGNAGKSSDKHDVSQAESEQVFFNKPLLVVADVKHSESEPRFHALGRSEGNRWLHFTFTLRAEQTLIRVISARPMSRKERATFAQAIEKDTEI